MSRAKQVLDKINEKAENPNEEKAYKELLSFLEHEQKSLAKAIKDAKAKKITGDVSYFVRRLGGDEHDFHDVLF